MCLERTLLNEQKEERHVSFFFHAQCLLSKRKYNNKCKSHDCSKFLVGLIMLKFYQINLSVLQISTRVYYIVYFLYFGLLFSITASALCTACLIIVQMNPMLVIVNKSMTESGYHLVCFLFSGSQKSCALYAILAVNNFPQLPIGTKENQEPGKGPKLPDVPLNR